MINENITFEFHGAVTKARGIYIARSPTAVNEIIWEFYAHLGSLTDIQPVFSKERGGGQVMMFIRQDILASLLIKVILVDSPSLGVEVA